MWIQSSEKKFWSFGQKSGLFVLDRWDYWMSRMKFNLKYLLTTKTPYIAVADQIMEMLPGPR